MLSMSKLGTTKLESGYNTIVIDTMISEAPTAYQRGTKSSLILSLAIKQEIALEHH